MVWKEILIGFTVAGLVAEFVPQRAWQALFLAERGDVPGPLRSLENALVAPLVAACTASSARWATSDGVLALFELELEGPGSVAEITAFALDYSFVLNVGFAMVAIALVLLGRGHDHD